MENTIDKKQLKKDIIDTLSKYFSVNEKDASPSQIYKAVVITIKDILLEKRKAFNIKQREQGLKKVYYLCMEFLVGRSLRNNCFNLNIENQLDEVLKDFNTNLNELCEMESDPGLGNGGLGRLAACFMDSLATCDYPAMGFSIRYEYGLFKQKIVDGWQIELPDQWLQNGYLWLTQRSDKHFNVRFEGKINEIWKDDKLYIDYSDYNEVEAVPYDMMISGAGTEAVAVLRLWRPVAAKKFDMQSFSQGDYFNAMKKINDADLIGKVLYPADVTSEGKALRLKQQYFFVSASIQNIIHDHIKRVGDLNLLPKHAAIHINDTHPSLCVPELMRILMDDHGLSYDNAFDIVKKTVAYTNHTVMSEALERWDEGLVERLLPRIYSIIKEINRRFCDKAKYKYGFSDSKVESVSIISDKSIKMANLSIVGSHSVNGVSALHSEIIKKTIFKDFYEMTPQKFTNVTNGIAHRRWLCQSNPKLWALIKDTTGKDCQSNPQNLKLFEQFVYDKTVLKELERIKLENKKEFAKFAQKRDIAINPYTIFDVQAKRLHEYKRQLLNVLKIISLYHDLKTNIALKVEPVTFVFAAKAAPGYYMAKQIIRLINFLSIEIKKDKRINEMINVVFMEDYNVTMAEKLIPAADLSEQISLAGKEASGTGNMKFMLNGALTLGTLDGANVEIYEAVGDVNMFLFGLTANEVEQMWSKGYNSTYFYNKDERLKNIVQMLNKGFNGTSFEDISKYLLTGLHGVADPYLCFADFISYFNAFDKAVLTYQDKNSWNKKCLINIARSGVFAADRSIAEYAENIWNLKRITND